MASDQILKVSRMEVKDPSREAKDDDSRIASMRMKKEESMSLYFFTKGVSYETKRSICGAQKAGHCVVWKPRFEVLIEQDELHCRATGVFGVPAPLRGLVEAISHVIPR